MPDQGSASPGLEMHEDVRPAGASSPGEENGRGRTSGLPDGRSTCPVCNTPGTLVKRLSPEFIGAGLERYYCEPVPAGLGLLDYDVLRCTECTLEYAFPMIPASESFYSWIAQRPNYYPNRRWEWERVAGHARRRGLPGPRVLEVGCGSGIFLGLLRKDLMTVSAVGLDPTGSSVAKCLEAGIEAYPETIEAYASNPRRRLKTFDLIVAFHCLEHVADPKGFLRSMLALSNAGTSIFVSTPYSPMYFERNWHDPLNHPPHHLTRWNETAYAALASQLRLKLELSMPRARGTLSRALAAAKLLAHGPNHGPRNAVSTVFSHPLTFAREFLQQSARHRVNGMVAPNVILARFRSPA
ncbi:MAG: class I SAM-dependent methyltransferase [Bryobacterales bacterium]|nr:class I SAM-dependent methyltransferase [Bryobacterales bacterium]